MSHPLVMALFRDVDSAAAAAKDVHALGVERADLSVVARDHGVESDIARQIGGSPGSEIEDSPAAARLGALGGYILAAIAIGLATPQGAAAQAAEVLVSRETLDGVDLGFRLSEPRTASVQGFDRPVELVSVELVAVGVIGAGASAGSSTESMR